jgi:sugar-specific transcriptional regulator TrmB
MIQNMEKQEILTKIGLSKKESAIYLALLEHGPALISQIEKQTGLHRPAIYKALSALLSRGFVAIAPKGKQRRYVAEPPDRLRSSMSDLVSAFENLLPELEATHQAKKKKPIIKFLEGKDGITFVLNDIVTSLKRNEVFYRYSSPKDSKKNEKYLPRDYRKIRDEKGLQRFVITTEGSMVGKKPRLERSVKFVPASSGLFDYDITEIIYGNKIAFIDYNTEMAFVVENPVIAEFQRKIFKLLYDRLPETSWS